jgi:low temperature requirement protein LtrA
MMALIRNFRSWWRPSRRVGEQQDRAVSFLELFYDLAYVVLIAPSCSGSCGGHG